MPTTMKKSEMLAATKADVVAKLPLEEIGAVQIGVGLWAVPGPVIDGIQTYAKVSVTAVNPIGTEIDLDEAVADWQAECEERDAKAKAKAEEKARKAAEREAKAKAKSDE